MFEHRILITISIKGVDGKVKTEEVEKLCDSLEEVIGSSDIDSTEVISDWRLEH